MLGEPFLGKSGKELTEMLHAAGIPRTSVSLTNVLPRHPAQNDIKALCIKKAEVGKDYLYPPVSGIGNYLHPDICAEALPQLRRLIEELKPNLVVALGGTALWALCGVTGISKIRGTIMPSRLVPGQKVLPTFHPAYIMRVWKDRVIMVTDLIRAQQELQYPEIRKPSRKIWIEPTLTDLEIFREQYLASAELISCDIETYRRQITCVGFSPNKGHTLVIPFVDRRKESCSYWDDPKDEAKAWKFVQSIIEGPAPMVYQNGAYDIQYFAEYGFRPRRFIHDTMLMHHSLHPEMKKSLGFLASIYTEEGGSFKLFNPKGADHFKRED